MEREARPWREAQLAEAQRQLDKASRLASECGALLRAGAPAAPPAPACAEEKGCHERLMAHHTSPPESSAADGAASLQWSGMVDVNAIFQYTYTRTRTHALTRTRHTAAQDALDKILDHCLVQLEWRGQSLERFFAGVDTDQSSDWSALELANVLSLLGLPAQGEEQLDLILADLRGGSGRRVGIEELRCRLDVHRERRRLRDLLAQDTDFPMLVARLVLPSHAAACDVKALSTEGAELLQRLAPLSSQVASAVVRVASTEARGEHALASGGNSKFAMDSGGEDGSLIKAMFGDLGLFRRGLDELIGRPSANVEKAMEQEHCADKGFDQAFKTWNYGDACEHTPTEEYEFVVNPRQNKIYPNEIASGVRTKGRNRKLLDHLLRLPELAAARVTREELAALRLYTGPMYMHYNRELREALAFHLKAKAKELIRRFETEGSHAVSSSDLVEVSTCLGLEGNTAFLVESAREGGRGGGGGGGGEGQDGCAA